MKLIRSQHIYSFDYKGRRYTVEYNMHGKDVYTVVVTRLYNEEATYTLEKGSYPSRRQAASLVVRTERDNFRIPVMGSFDKNGDTI